MSTKSLTETLTSQFNTRSIIKGLFGNVGAKVYDFLDGLDDVKGDGINLTRALSNLFNKVIGAGYSTPALKPAPVKSQNEPTF